jgi:hypothetical protein
MALMQQALRLIRQYVRAEQPCRRDPGRIMGRRRIGQLLFQIELLDPVEL